MADKKPAPPPAAMGGEARARKLSSERRSEIATRAALTRWVNEGKEPPALAKYGAPDRPLRIGDIEIPCYVLADGRRVLAQRGFQTGIGMSTSGGSGGAQRMGHLVRRLREKGIPVGDLPVRIEHPIPFIPPHGGKLAYGYEASILPDLCNIILEARNTGKLLAQQEHIADVCEVLVRGLAKVGIIALVDEATGYQELRARDALAEILEAFVAKELRPYIKTFPPAFYEQICRLNGWTYNSSNALPRVIGHWTNNIVYRRLAPGVLAELRKVTPRDDKGRLKHRLFQRLTDDIGDPKLREHLAAVIMLMKYSPDWQVFMERLDKEFPQWGDTLMLPFPKDYAGPSDPTA